MDESANRGKKLKRCSAIPEPKASDSGGKSFDDEEARGKVCLDFRSLNDRGPTIAEAKSRDIERIAVKGFDGHDHEDVKSALREHFASCGRITDINIWVGWRVTAHIYFVGKGAADKALKLDGSVVAAGGWKVCAEPYPFSEDRIDVVIIQGYDTSLSDSEIDVAVRDFLSSCGQVIQVVVSERGHTVTYIKGFFAAEKALKLDGSYFKGRKVAVSVLTTPVRNRARIRGRPFLTQAANNMTKLD